MQKDVGIACTGLQNTNTRWHPSHAHNHHNINSCKLQLAEISTTATYVAMVMWEWCRDIIATLHVYFVEQCHPYINHFKIIVLVSHDLFHDKRPVCPILRSHYSHIICVCLFVAIAAATAINRTLRIS